MREVIPKGIYSYLNNYKTRNVIPSLFYENCSLWLCLINFKQIILPNIIYPYYESFGGTTSIWVS